MISCVLQGGLGNKLFQIAVTIGTARKLGTDYLIPQFAESIYFAGHFKTGKCALPQYKETGFHFTPIEKDNIELFGYFQSKKYWEHCEQEIKELFKPAKDLLPYLSAWDWMREQEICAIHVRKGDYLNLKDYHFNLQMDYYEKAMQRMNEKGINKFAVFSDDIYWCRKNFPLNCLFINQSPAIDFFLMSRCDHFIIANSSYSWWASELCNNPDKIIIAPKNWFGVKNLHKDTKDLYTSEMEVI